MITKLRAALKMNNLSTQEKATKSKSIIDQMKASGYFPDASMPITYVALETSVTNLEDAILEAKKGTPGSTSNMHEKERIMLAMFGVVRAHVELVANDTTDPKTVIESTGLTAVTTKGNTPVTSLQLDAIGNGVLEISVPRDKGIVAFIYEYSADGGASWLDLDTTKLASVQLKNQTPGSTIYVRYATIGKTKSAFIETKSAMVI